MICTKHDNYITEYIEQYPCWTVTLTSGLIVFQDDNRPNITPTSAWQRLYYYCHDNNDYIKKMSIRFRSNIVSLPSDADGYYFSKGARGGIFLNYTIDLFFVGTLNNDMLKVQCWKVPEMFLETTENRNKHKAGLCLISKDIPPT